MLTRVVLADDHAILRDGLRGIIEAEADLKVVGEASNGRQAIEMVAELCPDIVVMDIGMPDMNGVEAAGRIHAIDDKIKVIALSMFNEKQFVLAMLDAGACAYVTKSSASGELVRAIRAAQKNQKYLSADVASVVVDAYTSRAVPSPGTARSLLTGREREVLQMLAEGKSSRELAKVLHISESTADVHRRNIMKKLDLHTIAELTKFAVREGLTSV